MKIPPRIRNLLQMRLDELRLRLKHGPHYSHGDHQCTVDECKDAIREEIAELERFLKPDREI